jgi:D-beta-D-heptose 7-phosphate kinase / D-beta-D-heptose 1-phosphate adenosyltransferase
LRAEPALRYRDMMHGTAPPPTPLAGTPDVAPSPPTPSTPPADLAEAVRQLRRGAVLVVGDAMLDRYVYGRVARVSPEAPVPVLAVEREVALPGGAGNVVRNLTALGAAVAFVSVVGDDQAGSDLTGLIGGQPGVEPWLLVEGGRATTTKTRFVAAGQHMLRADHEQLTPVQSRLAERLVRIAADAVAATAVMALSDYSKGTLAGDVPARLIAAARKAGRKVAAAPRGADLSRYAGADLVLLDAAELALAAGMQAGGGDAEAVVVAAASLRAAHGFGAVMVLRSESGVTLVEEDGAAAHHWPTGALETVDWAGTGDAVLAVAACGLAAGLPLPTVARLGALAAGIVVGKSGIAVVREDEFLEALVPGRQAARKLASRAQAAERVERWRRDGFRVGLLTAETAAAYPHLVDEPRSWCDRLVVGVPEAALTAERFAALGGVDLVARYGADGVLDLIRLLRPDVLVQDPAGAPDTVAGGEILQEWGGTVRKPEPSPVG